MPRCALPERRILRHILANGSWDAETGFPRTARRQAAERPPVRRGGKSRSDRRWRSAMRFTPTELQGAFVVEPTPAVDERGSFARIFCEREFGEHGLEARFVQHSRSQSVMRGTLRGMHFQLAPHAEVKVVSCLRGAMFDVIIDLRPESPTYRRWIGVELTPHNQ